MLYYDRMDVCEAVDANKTSESKECDISCYVHFLDKGITFQPYVCNGGHDVLMMSMNLSDITIRNIYGTDYHCIINGISKSEVIKLMQNIDSTEKNGNVINYKNHKKFSKHI